MPLDAQKSRGKSSEALQSRTRQSPAVDSASDSPHDFAVKRRTEASTEAKGQHGLSSQQWLAPYLIGYGRCYGERASPQAVRRIAKGMRELERVFPRAEILVRWDRYLAATALRWYSVERFGETWPRWGAGITERIPYSQSVDEADRRAGIPLRGDR